MTTVPQPASADLDAIRDVLNRLVTAWNQADGDAYGALFTDDADYIDVTGGHTRGGPAIGQLHQFLFNGPLRGSKLEADGYGSNVQLIAPDVAIVIAVGTSRLAEQASAPEDRRSINTTILVKRAGEWRIRAFQNNRVQPPPQR